jgi:hypothetical protein
VSIDEIFTSSSKHNLASYTDLRIFLKSDGRFLLVPVVEDDCDAGLSYSGLPTFVDEVLPRLVNATPDEKFSLWEHTWRFCARTVVMFVIPRTKHIESRIFDFPLPFRPVIELKLSSLYLISMKP